MQGLKNAGRPTPCRGPCPTECVLLFCFCQLDDCNDLQPRLVQRRSRRCVNAAAAVLWVSCRASVMYAHASFAVSVQRSLLPVVILLHHQFLCWSDISPVRRDHSDGTETSVLSVCGTVCFTLA